jgi:hypothetical protein
MAKIDYFIRFRGSCIPLGISFCNTGQKLNFWVNFQKLSILAFFQFGLLSVMYLLEKHTRYGKMDYFIRFRGSCIPLGISFCNIGQKVNFWVNFQKVWAFFQFGLHPMMYLLENHTRYGKMDYFIRFVMYTFRDPFLLTLDKNTISGEFSKFFWTSITFFGSQDLPPPPPPPKNGLI